MLSDDHYMVVNLGLIWDVLIQQDIALIHCGLMTWRHMATLIWVNIGSGNDLLSNDTKPLPESMLIITMKGVLLNSHISNLSGSSHELNP